MSFDKITADYQPRKKEVKISSGGVDYTFTAKEISYLANQEILIRRTQELPFLAHLIVASIVDQDGKSMSLAQAERLSAEHAEILLAAAFEVNKVGKEESEKN